MDRAFADLARYGTGIQLTPGNMPTAGFEAAVREHPTRTHHGFRIDAFRTREVWADDGRCLVTSDSVHPPRAGTPAADRFLDEALPSVETMYPGWALADGAALGRAMDRGVRLAVDISHLHIQREQGLLDGAVLSRVFEYDRIEEVHVSANDGRRDLHDPLREHSFGLSWARARLAAGTPVILECYFHRLSDSQRQVQIDLARGP
jgi:hypothetical protein